MCAPEEALAITGYQVGAMPPFGHREALPALVDERCLRPERVVYVGGGSRSTLLELASGELLRALTENAPYVEASRFRRGEPDAGVAYVASPSIVDVTTSALKE